MDRHNGCETTSGGVGVRRWRAPGPGGSALRLRQAGVPWSWAQLTTSALQLAEMVAGVSLLLRALPLLLWGCRDAHPARRGHTELRQEAEVRGVPGREGDTTQSPSP